MPDANAYLSDLKNRLRAEITDIENRTDLSDEQKVAHIRHIGSSVCAALAIQPIPFADIFILTPLQAYMGSRIAAIRRFPVSEHKASEIVKEIGSLVGMAVAAQQLVIGAYKTVLPFLGAITTIPIVYGLTFAMGGVMDYYFKQKAAGRPVDPSIIKDLWSKATKEGRTAGKARAKTISKEFRQLGNETTK